MMLPLLLAGSIAAGLSASSNLGEQTGLIGLVQFETNGLRLEAFYDTSNKVQTKAGFRTGADIDVLSRITDSVTALIGVGQHYRSSGYFTDGTTWVRAGVTFENGAGSLMVTRDLNGDHAEWQVEERARIRGAPFFEIRIGFESYLDFVSLERTWGSYWAFVVGIGGRR